MESEATRETRRRGRGRPLARALTDGEATRGGAAYAAPIASACEPVSARALTFRARAESLDLAALGVVRDEPMARLTAAARALGCPTAALAVYLAGLPTLRAFVIYGTVPHA